MRLLQTEIEVVPGRDPDRAARKEGYVGIGSAYLEIKNTTDRVNSYTLRVVCDHPYWQAGWYQLMPMPPETGEQNQPPKGKPDQPGAKNQSLKIHINKEGVRKILVAFKVPENAEARAGAYPIRIIVESVITDATVASGPPRVTELPATLIVRPFYDWEISFRPEDKSVGALRRRAHVELFVTNKGNDWLYLEFKKTPSQVMSLDAPVVRLAVPPPEPGQTFERSVPLKAVTKLRTIRGDKNGNNYPVTVTRVDAPTVPPLPDAVKECQSANLGRSVVVTPTNQTQAAETPGTLTYCPPIPATLAGFFQAILRNAKAIAMLAVGAFLMFMGIAYLYEKTLHSINNVYLDGVQGEDVKNWEAPDALVLKGDLLKPCVIDIAFVDDNHKTDPPTVYEIEPAEESYKVDNERPWYTAMTWGVNAPHYTIPLDDAIRSKIGKATGTIKSFTVARRFMFLGSLGMKGVVPKNVPSGFHVGPPPVNTAQLGASAAFTALNPGDKIVLIGTGFGSDPKGATATVGDSSVHFASWTDVKIEIPVPASIQPGTQFSLVIVRGNASIWSGPFSIKAQGATTAGAPQPTTAGAPAEATPGASASPTTGGGQSGNAGGGGSTPTAAPTGPPPPPAAVSLAQALGSGKPSKAFVASLPQNTPADHAIRAIAFFMAEKPADGQKELTFAANHSDSSKTMNALLDAAYIAQEKTNQPPDAGNIKRLSADIIVQLGARSPLKLPYLIASQMLQKYVGDADAKTFTDQVGGGG